MVSPDIMRHKGGFNQEQPQTKRKENSPEDKTSATVEEAEARQHEGSKAKTHSLGVNEMDLKE